MTYHIENAYIHIKYYLCNIFFPHSQSPAGYTKDYLSQMFVALRICIVDDENSFDVSPPTLSTHLPLHCIYSYDSEGRLTNVTFPTGVVTNLHGDMSSGAVAVDIETSGRDEDVSITTNLSSIDSFYTLVQGKEMKLDGLVL